MDALTLATRKAQLADLRRHIAGNRRAIDDAVRTLDRLVATPQAKAWLARIREIRHRYAHSSDRVLDLMEEGRETDAANLMNAETLPALDALQKPIQALLEVQKMALPGAHTAVREQLDSALALMAALDGAPAAVWHSASHEKF